MNKLKLLIPVLIFASVVDMLWLRVIARSFYMTNLQPVLRKSISSLYPYLTSAVLVYIAISIGLIYFVLDKADGNYVLAAVWGALFGAILYVVYDCTNFAILANWPLGLSIVDILWGVFLCAITSMFMVLMDKYL